MIKFETESCSGTIDNNYYPYIGGNYYPYNTYIYPRYYQEGWVCPKCGRVFSPSVTECSYCNSNKYTVVWDYSGTSTIEGINNGEEDLVND